ncbi:MAG: hypothetical protein ACP5G1_02695 [Nanopusillaceae archaeon]
MSLDEVVGRIKKGRAELKESLDTYLSRVGSTIGYGIDKLKENVEKFGSYLNNIKLKLDNAIDKLEEGAKELGGYLRKGTEKIREYGPIIKASAKNSLPLPIKAAIAGGTGLAGYLILEGKVSPKVAAIIGGVAAAAAIAGYYALRTFAPQYVEKPVPADHLPDYIYLVFKPEKVIEYGEKTKLEAELLNPNGQPIGKYILEYESTTTDPDKLMKDVKNLFARDGFDITVLYVVKNGDVYTYPSHPEILLVKNNNWTNWSYVLVQTSHVPQTAYAFETGNIKVVIPSIVNGLVEDKTIQKWRHLQAVANAMGGGLEPISVIQVKINGKEYTIPAYFTESRFSLYKDAWQQYCKEIGGC